MLPFHDEPVIRENIITKILFASCSAKISYRKNFPYMVYYGEVTLRCRADSVTIKTTYNNVLYLFIDSLTLFVPALADLKEITVLHVIDEFKFQQVIYEKEEFVPL